MINRRVAGWCLIATLVVPRVLYGAVVVHQSPESQTGPALIPDLPAATSLDAQFLDALHQERLHVGQNDQDAIKLGRTICKQLDDGQSERQQEQLAVSSGLSAQDAHTVVVISVFTYCSQYAQPRPAS